MERSTWRARRVRPNIEGLEGRQLLSGGVRHRVQPLPVFSHLNRQINYATPQGTQVVVILHGFGSLAGSTVAPNGALNLVISGTNAETAIESRTSGGSGRAPLQSVLYPSVAPQDLSGIGGTTLDVLNLQNFDLLPGGLINLTAGIHKIELNSVAGNTQVNLRELPDSFNGTGAFQTATSNGQTLQFLSQVDSDGNFTGSQTLVGISGQFVPGTNLPVTKATENGPQGLIGTPLSPPGLVAVVNRVHGAPQSGGLPHAQIFGYDSVQNALIRFDVTTGDPLQTIPVPAGGGQPIAGAALARNNGALVVLVGTGSTIQAFDAVSGAPVGQFTTSNLGSIGMTSIDEIGSSGAQTVIGDAQDGPDGTLLAIDVTASLASGNTVAVGSPYQPQRQFELGGGLAGIDGSQTLFAAGAAHFDSFQPDTTQLGVLALSATGGNLNEISRNPIKSHGNYINTGPFGTIQGLPILGLGSVDQNLALVTGIANGQNVVNLYTQSLALAGTVHLTDPNLLTGVSESFRPGLVGAAVFDVQGNIQSFNGQNAQGLVLNDLGNLNLVKVRRMANSTIQGFPFSHAAITKRTNVTIVTPSRTADDRNGVTVVPGLLPTGPLFLP